MVENGNRNHFENLRGKPGKLRVIDAPMFAGKTDLLIIKAKRFERSGIPLQVYKHPLDTRYEGVSRISSHNGSDYPCKAYANPLDIYHDIKPETLIVMIDEAQFFVGEDEEKLISLINQLVSEGRLVIVAGLGLDFKGEPFGPMPALEVNADSIEKLTAVCAVCGSLEANRTQRIVNGQPADYHSPLIVVGAAESYEARCRDCHEVPGKPTFEELMNLCIKPVQKRQEDMLELL